MSRLPEKIPWSTTHIENTQVLLISKTRVPKEIFAPDAICRTSDKLLETQLQLGPRSIGGNVGRNRERTH